MHSEQQPILTLNSSIDYSRFRELLRLPPILKLKEETRRMLTRWLTLTLPHKNGNPTGIGSETDVAEKKQTLADFTRKWDR